MDDASILDVVRRCVRSETGNADAVITEKTVSEHVPGWDSLAHSRIVMAIELELGIELDLEQAYRVHDVGGLVSLIRNVVSTGQQPMPQQPG